MIVAKNMLIPQVRRSELLMWDVRSWGALMEKLRHIDECPNCYIVERVKRMGGDSGWWTVEYRQVM